MPITYETKQEELYIWKKDPSKAFPQHLHKYIEIMYVKSGNLSCTVDFDEYELKGGDLLFVFPERIHSNGIAAKTSEIYVMLFPSDGIVLGEIFGGKTPSTPVLRSVSSKEIDFLFEEILKEYNKKTPLALSTAIGYSYVLISKLLEKCDLTEAKPLPDNLERQLVKYCTEHFDQPITLSYLAEKFGYNPSYLSHIFSQKFKMSFLKFITALRIDEAKRLLRGNKVITQIALDCGFGSIRNFNRAFKEATGMTPNEYRKAKQMT